MEKLGFKPRFFCWTADTVFFIHPRKFWARGKTDGTYQTFYKALWGRLRDSKHQRNTRVSGASPRKFSQSLFLAKRQERKHVRSWKLLSRAARAVWNHGGRRGQVLRDGLRFTERPRPQPQNRCSMRILSKWPEEILSSNLFEPELNTAANICWGPVDHIYQSAK